jgi:serine/threonine-protein kinase
VRPARFAVGLALGAIACIDEPSFVLDEGDASPSSAAPSSGAASRDGGADGTTAEDDDMVRISSTTFTTTVSLEKGKGKDKDDAQSTAVLAFWIDAHEVSAAAYASCVIANRCTPAGGGPGCTVVARFGAHPVNCVTTDQARAFCAWRGKRLVRNDEWTAASAGARLRPYPWGAEAPSGTRLNACGAGDCGGRSMYPESDGFVTTAPCGSYPLGRSPEGVWDLAGNVAEWVDLSGESVTRGGSFADDELASVSSLGLRATAGSSVTVGFRCAKDD